jgi:very-short-patch-repair endonuclease
VTAAIARINRQIITDRGWRPGTDLENRVAFQLSRWGFSPADVAREHRVGRYRLDFAWPDAQMAIEADGWHHRSPEGAAKDAERDSTLRAAGWVVLRVDDRHGEEALAEQLCRAVRLIRWELAPS